MSIFLQKSQRHVVGFTIVELIIVIVVIGILATITLVGYSGVTQSSKSNQAQANASTVQKKIESYESATGSYPTATSYTTYLANLNSLPESSLGDTTITLGSLSNSPTNIQISQCTAPTPYANGMAYRLEYWDFSTNQIASNVISESLNTTPCGTWTPLT